MPAYMKYEGINGEATGKHDKWIIVESCQIGISSRNKDINVTKFMDSTSSQLFQESLIGKGKKVTIDFVAEGESIPYLSIELENVIISSYSISGSGNRPMESLSLNYTKITYTRKPTAPAKDPKNAQEKATWNMAIQNSRYS